MLRQIKYFQAVVQENSFTKAAEKYFISQSAISQQIQNLESELDVRLLERKNRSFTLTPAGEYFYQKSLLFLSDFDRICQETRRIALGDQYVLHLGYLNSFSGVEFQKAVAEFCFKYPEISIDILNGSHEKLFELLRNNKIDLVLSDQRRAFSDEYINNILLESEVSIEITLNNPIAQLNSIEVEDLKNIPCIIISSEEEQKNEQTYYNNIFGINSQIIFAQNLEEARLKVLSGQGFILIDTGTIPNDLTSSLKRIPLKRNNKPIYHKYCSFYKINNSDFYIQEFSNILLKQFE